MLDSVYVLCKFIDTIPAARLRLCTHKNQFDKKKQNIPREAMHRIEIKVLREEKKNQRRQRINVRQQEHLQLDIRGCNGFSCVFWTHYVATKGSYGST